MCSCVQIIGRLKGRELEGRTYEPILPYYEHLKGQRAPSGCVSLQFELLAMAF